MRPMKRPPHSPISEQTAASRDSQQPVTESLESLVVTETSDEVPDYIKAAAENVSRALSAEAEDDIEQSLASYRAAIGEKTFSLKL